MATIGGKYSSDDGASASLAESADDLLLKAMNRGDVTWETGRSIVTFKQGATEDAIHELQASGLSVANASDVDYGADVSALEDTEALVFTEIGAAVVAGHAARAHDMTAYSDVPSDSPFESIEAEVFVFADSVLEEYVQAGYAGAADGGRSEYLRGFLRAATAIREDLVGGALPTRAEEEPEVLGATWGLTACRVPPSTKSGAHVNVAVLDTGLDLSHKDFAGARIAGQQSFVVGQEVQDLHSHGTHCTGTACGPKSPGGSTQRYGAAYRGSILVGKVLSNTGSGTQAQVLAGMNWAIAQRCEVISMSLGSATTVNTAYTAAGQKALDNGSLIVAAAGNSGPAPTGAPANSPTIMSVASLDRDLRPSSFSQRGKIEIAAPGRDVFSSVPMPSRYGTKSGTSMATPHVAGCAALWAETSPNLRAMSLWRQLQATARKLPFPPTLVGAGLVQAP